LGGLQLAFERPLLPLSGAGSNPSFACPLHDGDNPTVFHLYEDGQRWHCFTQEIFARPEIKTMLIENYMMLTRMFLV
jgi:hypothetical protein